MAGYVLANVSWTSAEGRQAYLDLLGPTLEAHGGTITARMSMSWRATGTQKASS